MRINSPTYNFGISICKNQNLFLLLKSNIISLFENVITFYSHENAFLLSQLHDVGVYLLIGLTDSMYEGTYLWTDQSSVDYTNWYRYYYYGPTTDCVYFHGVNGKWVNRDCKTETGFICQKCKYFKCTYELCFFIFFTFFLCLIIVSHKRDISVNLFGFRFAALETKMKSAAFFVRDIFLLRRYSQENSLYLLSFEFNFLHFILIKDHLKVIVIIVLFWFYLWFYSFSFQRFHGRNIVTEFFETVNIFL